MKVALVNPPYKRNIIRRWYCSVETGHYLFPPLELCYVSSILKREGAEIEFFDCIAEKINKKTLKKHIKTFKPDIIIFFPGFQTLEHDVKLMSDMKSTDENVKLICFGYFPTLFGKEIMRKYPVDIIIKNHPEFTIGKLYNAISRNSPLIKIENLFFRYDGKIIETRDEKVRGDLNKLPFPDRDILNNKAYLTFFQDNLPMTTINTSYGCDYKCVYCITPTEGKFCNRDPKNVVEEIKSCIKNYKIKTFRIVDDNFFVEERRVRELCNLIIKEKLNIKWASLSTADINENLVPLLKMSGCKRLIIGIESGSQKILKYYSRPSDLNKAKKLFNLLRRENILPVALFIIGAPIETKKDIRKTLDYAKGINLPFVFIEALTPLPGTILFNRLDKKNKINFSLFPYKIEYEKLLPSSTLKEEIFSFYLRYYLRPSYFSRNFNIFLRNPKFLFKMPYNFIDWLRRKYTFGYE